MGKARVRGSSSSSSIEGGLNYHCSSSFFLMRRDLCTDLRLGLGNTLSREQFQPPEWTLDAFPSNNKVTMEVDDHDSNRVVTFYVKVYMEGLPIGRKLDLLANGGFLDLICTINYMFQTTIIWSEEERAQSKGRHVLTYEDKEGDWLLVGDLPWKMFLSSVKRLKITRTEKQ